MSLRCRVLFRKQFVATRPSPNKKGPMADISKTSFQFPIRTITGVLVAVAITATTQADEAAGVAYFETNIRPLLIEHCYECHSASAQPIKGGLRLDSKVGWTAGGESGPAIVPGDAGASLLIRAIRNTDANMRMPPDKALPPEAIEKLERWIQTGAQDPRDTEPTLSDEERKRQIQNPSDPVAGREHWAFRPLAVQSPPEVHDLVWARSPIDHFILARLTSANLRPSPAADRRILARRITYQLIGLPPTVEQIRMLQDDQSREAVERLVDALLSSRQFGERWGRHWLDLARYADSNGLDENFLFREAWRYRNWVIDALNADMPFDRFLLEQIAGDLLPFETIEQRDRQRIAGGFMVIGPKVLLGNDDKRQRMEVADEQIDTIGRAVLAQTLGCARCHDHKFDPVPTADYYAIAGILTSTNVMEQRYMLGEQRVMERLVGLGSEGDILNGAYEKYWLDRPKMKEAADRAKSVMELLKKGDVEAIATITKDHPDALAGGAADTAQTPELRQEAQQALVTQLEAVLANPPQIPGRAMIPSEAETPADEHVRLAGQFDRLGPQIPRGFLQVLCASPGEPIPASQSGRLQLSHWLTDVDHGAGLLTARVLANRVWHHLMGRGIVPTVDNFGRTGDMPSHPELLDYLAQRLIDSGWSIKSLVREIINSQTFALSSEHNETDHAIDPDNRLLWRANRRRLEPEALRDTMLLIADKLDLTSMESTVSYLGDQATGVGENVRRRTDFPCRSIYLPVIRNDLPELFDVFDFANPHSTTGARPQTMVPQQGLFLLNDSMVMEAAEATAKRLLSGDQASEDGGRIDKMFELILAITPTEEERSVLLTFVRQTKSQLTSDGDPEPTTRAWSLACHALFALSRFQFLE